MNTGQFLTRRRQTGLSMLEILITMVITAFGLLGLAGFLTQSTLLTVESNQRARAAATLEDMRARLKNNKANVASYVSATVHGATALTCSGLAVGSPARDLCEWNNLLAGVSDQLTNSDGQTKLGFRGCITQPDALLPVFIVTVAWGSSMQGVAPTDPCGANLFGNDSLRRVIRTQVRIANLGA